MKTEMDHLIGVMEAAIMFKEKVQRDSPSCFQPSKELQTLFDRVDAFMDPKEPSSHE